MKANISQLFKNGSATWRYYLGRLLGGGFEGIDDSVRPKPSQKPVKKHSPQHTA